MMKYLLFAFFVCAFSPSAFSRELPKNRLDCPISIHGIGLPAQCQLDFIPSAEMNHNIEVSALVDLAPLVDGFGVALSSALNKDTCRERVNVRSASLQVEDGYLLTKARIWIEKRFCEGPIKTRIVEKTGDISVRFTPQVSGNEVRLVATVEAIGLTEFEEDVAKFLGIHLRDKLKSALDSQLRLQISKIGLPPEIASSIAFRTAILRASPPTLEAKISAHLNVSDLIRLLNLWRSQ